MEGQITTWRHSSTGFFWPWELRKHVPDARVMLFGYDADLAPQLGTNLIRIKGLAENLLSSLVNKRQEDYLCCVLSKECTAIRADTALLCRR